MFPKKNRAANMLVPPHTRFDYLEGAFRRAERARYGGLALTGLALIALAAIFVVGLNAKGAIVTEEQIHSQATQTKKELTFELSVKDTIGGFPTTVVDNHITQRTQTISVLLHNELDVVAITQALQTSTPKGLELTSVNFAPPTPTASSDDEPAATQPASPVGLTVTATAPSFDLIPIWLEKVKAIPALTDTEVEWTGGSNVEVSLTATFTPQAYTPRSTQLLSKAP